MLKRLTTLFILSLLVSSICFAQKNTFLGAHFSENRDEFKFLDLGIGNTLSSWNSTSIELGIKIRQPFNANLAVESGLIWKRFSHPTGVFNDFVKADNFLLPIDFNYRFLINKKYKIYLAPTLGAYFGYNPFQKSNQVGAGTSNPNPFTDDQFSYEFQSKINQNWAGAKAGVGIEFTIFKESFLKIGYYQTSSFFKIYENTTTYTRNNSNLYLGKMSSRGYYKSILVDFYFPIP